MFHLTSYPCSVTACAEELTKESALSACETHSLAHSYSFVVRGEAAVASPLVDPVWLLPPMDCTF